MPVIAFCSVSAIEYHGSTKRHASGKLGHKIGKSAVIASGVKNAGRAASYRLRFDSYYKNGIFYYKTGTFNYKIAAFYYTITTLNIFIIILLYYIVVENSV